MSIQFPFSPNTQKALLVFAGFLGGLLFSSMWSSFTAKPASFGRHSIANILNEHYDKVLEQNQKLRESLESMLEEYKKDS